MYHRSLVALTISLLLSVQAIPPLPGEHRFQRDNDYATSDLDAVDSSIHGEKGSYHDPYYLEGAIIDIEKMLENDPELRERYDALTKDERREFIATLSSFNEAFQKAFEALLPEGEETE
jgi:hypothetical protein